MQAVCFKAKIYKGKFTSTIHAFPLTVDYTVRQSALHLSGLWQLWRINIEKKKKIKQTENSFKKICAINVIKKKRKKKGWAILFVRKIVLVLWNLGMKIYKMALLR